METYQKLRQMGAGVMSMAQKSKQDRLFDEANRKFLEMNSEWNTPENRAVVDSFVQTDLDKRQPYMFNNPLPAFDLAPLAEQANNAAKSEFKNQTVTGMDKDGNYIPGDKYVRTRSGTEYDEAKFMDVWGSNWGKKDKYGNQLSDFVKRYYYDPLTPQEKAKLDATGDPLKAAWMELGKKYLLKGKGESALDMNKAWQEEQSNATSRYNTRVSASSRETPDKTVAVTGNALDSIPDTVMPNGNRFVGGKYVDKDGNNVKGKSVVSLSRQYLSEELVSTLLANNKSYFGTVKSKGGYGSEKTEEVQNSDFDEAIFDIQDGVVQSVKFKVGNNTLPAVTRDRYKEYQEKIAGKQITEYGNKGGQGAAPPPANIKINSDGAPVIVQ
jgi:hypothetical protein